MLSLTAMIFLSLFISNLFMLITFLINKKKYTIFEKLTSFECGFTPLTSSRTPLSMHFFFIALIFLIFDVEIVLIMPMMIIFKINNIFVWSFMSSYFITLLLISIFYEWNQMMLNWNIFN